MATAAAPSGRHHDAHPPWRWRGVGSAIVAVALVGGVALRVFAPSPLWLDEALSVNIARLGFGDMVDALRHDGHPALYYLLLGWWIDLFGDGDTAVRALSGLFSFATVPILWAVGRRHGTTLGSTAALVALTSPYLLRYGTEARMYALLAMLVALGWLLTERARDRPTRLRLTAVAGAGAALVHTHYWAFFVVGAAVTLLGLSAWRRPDRRATEVKVAAALTAGGATFVLWLDVFLEQLSSTGTPWADRARPAEIVMETVQAVGGNNRFEGELLGIVMVLLVAVGATAIATEGSRLLLGAEPGPVHPAVLMTLLTLGLGGGVALATGGAYEGRYSAVVVAFVLLLAARGIVMLPEPARVGSLALVVLFGLAIGADEARRDRTQAAEVAAVIDAGWVPGDVVAFCPDQLGPATTRALRVPAPVFAYPRGDGRFVDWQDYADVIAARPPEDFVAEITAAAAGNDIWTVIGLGYKSLGTRCEAIAEQLSRTHRADHLVAPSDAFEPMLLTRYEALG